MSLTRRHFFLLTLLVSFSSLAISPTELQWNGASYTVEDNAVKVVDDSVNGGDYLLSDSIPVDFTRPWKFSTNVRCVVSQGGRTQGYVMVYDADGERLADFGTQSLIDNSEWTWISVEISPEQWPSAADHVRLLLQPAAGDALGLGTAWFREILFGPVAERTPIPGVDFTREYLFKFSRVELLGKDLKTFPYEDAPGKCQLEILCREPSHAQAIQLITDQELGDAVSVAVWMQSIEEYGAPLSLPLERISRGYQMDVSSLGAWRKLCLVFPGQSSVCLDDVVVSRPVMAAENWNAEWIWFTSDRVESITVFLRKEFHLESAPVRARLQYRTDDGGLAFLNGKPATDADVTSLLQEGDNVFSCYVNQNRYAAGLLAELDLDFADGSARKIVTDKTWRFYPSDAEIRAQAAGGPLRKPTDGWQETGFDDSDWGSCVELGKPPLGIWGPVPYVPYARRTPMTILEDPRPAVMEAGKTYARTLRMRTGIPCGLPYPVNLILERDGVEFLNWEAGIVPANVMEANLDFTFGTTQFLPPGEYQLRLVIPNYDATDAAGTLCDTRNVTVQNGRKAEPPDARLQRDAYGVPILTVNGAPHASIFSARLKTARSQHAAMFRKTGLHLYHAYLVPSWPAPDTPSFLPMDALAESFLQGDPDALMIVKIELRDGTPEWFLKLHPEEAVKYDNGRVVGRVSLASTRWRALVDDYLRGLIRHVGDSPYADHVIGYMVCEGEEGQWMHYWGGDNPQAPGTLSDYSLPMQEYFRKWLKCQYGSDQALQEAWNDPAVTLETAAIPTREERIARKMSLRLFPRDRKAADFGWALSDVTAEGIHHYARLIKEATGGKALTGALYGHLMDLGVSFLGEQTGYARQRLAVDSPYVDYYLGPISYSHRFRDVGYPGGYDMPSPGTLELRGKIWLNEDDLRTHLQFPAEYAYSVRTPRDTSQLLAREFARALCLRAGYYLYALGEGGLNWFDDQETLRTIAELQKVANETITSDRRSISQIASFFDDEAQCRQAQVGSGREATVNGAAIMQREALFRVGAPVDEFLQFDLSNEGLKYYRLYVLLNPFYLTLEEKEAVKALLQRDDTTMIFACLPGIAGDNGAELSTASELTGMNFSLEDKSREATFRTCRDFGNLPVGSVFGDKQLIFGPSAIPADYDEVLAEYEDDGAPAVVRKGKVYLTPVAHLPVEMLREIAREAGVFLYSEDDLAVYACQSFAAFHSERKEKPCTFKAPEGTLLKQVWPVDEKETLLPQDTVQWQNHSPETRIYKLIQKLR